MSRGGYGGGGLPLHARARRDPSPEACPVRHCWVEAPLDGGGPRAGLLLEWRRSVGGHWEGRVVYAAQLRPGQWATVEEWLSAELLSTTA